MSESPISNAADSKLPPAQDPNEWLTRVTDDDKIIGPIARRDCHGFPAHIHRSVHVLVLNTHGLLLLQKRSSHKDVQPGKWDTSVGGHVGWGQDYLEAAYREAEEELGIPVKDLAPLYASKIRNEIESENIFTFLSVCDGPFVPPAAEIDEVRFWSRHEIERALGQGVFTPNFEVEFSAFLTHPTSLALK
jgi:isopentenyldiphosphate isomerase